MQSRLLFYLFVCLCSFLRNGFSGSDDLVPAIPAKWFRKTGEQEFKQRKKCKQEQSKNKLYISISSVHQSCIVLHIHIVCSTKTMEQSCNTFKQHPGPTARKKRWPLPLLENSGRYCKTITVSIEVPRRRVMAVLL